MKFEASAIAVMGVLVVIILVMIAVNPQSPGVNEEQTSVDVSITLIPESEPEITSEVPAPGFEDVPEMIVVEEPETVEEESVTVSEIETESMPPAIEPEPETVGPVVVEVIVPEGSGVPGCDETNECYIPYEVTISVGDTVTWSNDDTAAHTVTSGTSSGGADGVFDSSLFMSGSTFEFTFDDSGTFDYFCMVHPWMTGQVQVS